jgi:conjugal transfer mating pair stabilization protein TraN
MKTIRLLVILWLALCGVESAFAQFPPGACTPVANSKRCTDNTPCKSAPSGDVFCLAGVSSTPAGAYQLPYSCWNYAHDYVCGSQQVNTCTPYENDKNCSLLKTVCDDTNPVTGACVGWTLDYECIKTPAVKEKRLVCTSGLFDPKDYPPPATPPSNFGKALTALEIARQASSFIDKANAFGGVQESCSKGYLGLNSCCRVIPGGNPDSVNWDGQLFLTSAP